MTLLHGFQSLQFTWALLPPAILISICGAISVALYRVFLHPLSRFPGPRRAAASGTYRTYFDVNGGMPKQIEKLHKRYGPIVRIAPNDLHFSEPSVYQQIYTNNSKLIKDPWLYSALFTPESVFGFINPHAARGRRDVLNPLFSRRSIISLQGLVSEKFDKLCDKLGEYSGTNKSVNLFSSFKCATVDIIMTFCFAQSMDALEYPGFNAPILRAMSASSAMFGLFKHFPLIRLIFGKTPTILSRFLSPEAGAFLLVRRVLKKQLDNFLANPEDLKNTSHPIIYHRLLDPTIKGASEAPATPKSLFEEATTMLFAGSDTVGNTLSVGAFHLLENPSVHQKLVHELTQAWPDLRVAPTYEELEKLPYLTAVIKESLRVSNGVVSPLPRIVPAGGMVIDGEFIPGGTVVMMTSTIVHGNEEIFPNSKSFIPERWMGPDAKELERYLVTFSKGSRQCLGINLAYCELYLGIARIFRRFEITLDGTTEEDMKWKDGFAPVFVGRNLQGFLKQREV